MNKHRFFTVPALYPEGVNEELNNFITSHRVINIEKYFVDDGAGSFWSICVIYTNGQSVLSAGKKTNKTQVDYREVLNKEDFALYARLRELRKKIAARDGVAPYIVFTNEQLARIVQDRVRTKAAMGKISGVGQAKIDKYADDFLAMLKQSLSADKQNETDNNTP